MRTILVAEDEPQIACLVRDYLEHAGFAVIIAADGAAALALARARRPDAHRPRPRPAAGRRPRRHPRDPPRLRVPILILSARGDEVDRVTGLELGADDYVVKPFSPRSSSPVSGPSCGAPSTRPRRRADRRRRPRARPRPAPGHGRRPRGPAHADRVRAPGDPRPRAGPRLDAVAAARRRARVRLETYERAIDGHIRNLRRKLEPAAPSPKYVRTVHGVGYALAEPDGVTDRPGPATSRASLRGRRAAAHAVARDRANGRRRRGLAWGEARGATVRARAGAGVHRLRARRCSSCSSASSPALATWVAACLLGVIVARGLAADGHGRRRRRRARPRRARRVRVFGPPSARSPSSPRPPTASPTASPGCASAARSGSRPRASAASFNAMAERLDRSRDDRRALLADVTHELRTPLTVSRRPRGDARRRPPDGRGPRRRRSSRRPASWTASSTTCGRSRSPRPARCRSTVSPSISSASPREALAAQRTVAEARASSSRPRGPACSRPTSIRCGCARSSSTSSPTPCATRRRAAGCRSRSRRSEPMPSSPWPTPGRASRPTSSDACSTASTGGRTRAAAGWA